MYSIVRLGFVFRAFRPSTGTRINIPYGVYDVEGPAHRSEFLHKFLKQEQNLWNGEWQAGIEAMPENEYKRNLEEIEVCS